MTHARRTTTRLAALVAACALALPVQASVLSAQALVPSPGADGAGDPYFPQYGNGGYDVGHYAVHVAYALANDQLTGDTTLTATATQDLSSLNLDLALPASQVYVDGVAATFTQGARELVVTPATPLLQGQDFTVRVVYAGHPGQQSGAYLGGWFLTGDGAVAAGEPEVAMYWYPSNDHPSDKATFDIYARVRSGKQVVSNGVLRGRKAVGGDVVWHWKMAQPMTSYLATLVIGDYQLVKGHTPAGVPYLNAITEHMSGATDRAARRSLAATPRIVDFFGKRFGAYPFDSAGGILANASFPFSLENQTRPIYSKVFFQYGENTEVVAHELAHMWWGDSVSVAQWRDIWLNEGFATWSSWLWYEHDAGVSLNRIFAGTYNGLIGDYLFWNIRVDDPGPDHVFDGAVYVRGALALQALRNKIGKAAHTRLLRAWARAHRYGNGSVAQFEAKAEQVSGKNLDTFFAAWLHQRSRPKPSKALGFPASMLGRPVVAKPTTVGSAQSLRNRM